MLDPEFSIGVLGGWRPFLELHTIEKLLKRIVYGRHYSKPSDLFFQDYRWEVWKRAQERETYNAFFESYKPRFLSPDERPKEFDGWHNPAPSKEVRR
jgi:hypothetical protein